MPTPLDDETRQEFLDRCIPILVDEGNDNVQAIAICSNMWADHLKKMTDLWWYHGDYPIKVSYNKLDR